jgi:fermentation-respiration switch protein FrsA (DUF1100 family)
MSVDTRARHRIGKRSAFCAALVLMAACGGHSTNAGNAPSPTASSASSAGASPETVAERCPVESGRAGDEPIRTLQFSAGDGTRLYGAVVGSGTTGVVLANDVPHDFCQEIPPAIFLSQHGYRALAFDYRGHGDSATADSAPGRLDQDVAGAAAELRRLGSTRIALFGSYAGSAACIVAADGMNPAADALVALSPALKRGEYVEGPFEPEGALQDAPKLRLPVLYVTAKDDRFIPYEEAQHAYRVTGSKDKSLLAVEQGPPGWYLLQYNEKVQRAVLTLLSTL